MSKIKLSIIIVNYNTGNFIKKCLESIIKSSSPINTEIIVVDNGSTDNSKTEINKFKNRIKNLKVILNKQNVGFAKANNIGLRIARGEYFLLLNPDTQLKSKTLEIMLKFLDNNPQIGVATCKVVLPNGEIDWASHRGFPTPWNAFCYFSGLAKIFSKSKFFAGYHQTYKDLSKPHEIDSPSGAFYLVRREVVNKVGLLDSSYFMYAEDLDWSYRIKKAGYKIYYYPKTEVLHYKGIASGIKSHSFKISQAEVTTRLRAMSAFYDTMKIFYNKHYNTKYPKFVKLLVFTGLTLMKIKRIAMLNRQLRVQLKEY